MEKGGGEGGKSAAAGGGGGGASSRASCGKKTAVLPPFIQTGQGREEMEQLLLEVLLPGWIGELDPQNSRFNGSVLA